MERRTFIKSLAAFTGLFTIGSKLELTRAFPFVRHKRIVPQMVSTTVARGTRTIRLTVPQTQKGDVLVAMILAYSPDGQPIVIEAQRGWTMFSSQEAEHRLLQTLYMRIVDDLADTEYLFAIDGAERSSGSLSVIRGAKIDAEVGQWTGTATAREEVNVN